MNVTDSSYYQFVSFCFVLRSVMAVGTAFNETAAVSIMTISFKHSLSSAQVNQILLDATLLVGTFGC